MDQTSPLGSTANKFLGALTESRHETSPFDYWLLSDALPDPVVDGIAALPFDPPSGATFDGRRETNNQTRVYFSPDMQASHPVCSDVVDTFNHPRVVKALEQATGADLSRGRLRIEYCQDVDGFWLEPHTDISVKLFTMLIYLSGDPALHDAGTDIYDATPEHNFVLSAPYEKKGGLIFIPGGDTWHGVSKRPINGIRKSIIVNFVTPEWRDTWELA